MFIIPFVFKRDLYEHFFWQFNRETSADGVVVCRAGLMPMQMMQLHWNPRLWRPRAMVFT